MGNFGVPNGGIDACYVNLINSHKIFEIKKAVVLIPFLHRRLLKFTKNNLYFQWPINAHTEWEFNQEISKDYFDIEFIKKELKKIKQELILDTDDTYSLKILKDITLYCEINHIDLYLSSFEANTYKIIKQKYHNILPFYDMSITNERAVDGIHPCKHHNRDWVEKIKNFLL